MTTVDQRTPLEPLRSLSGVLDAAASLASAPRRLLGVAGPPGAGKSTLASAVAEHLGSGTAIVGMDGFHLANAELTRLGRRERKGSPDTFDIGGLGALLERLRAEPANEIYAPVFDRDLEESIGSAVLIPSTTTLVIVEGNYLLRSTGGWERIAPLLDECWYIDVPVRIRERRLRARRAAHGDAAGPAAEWVSAVDLPNGRLVEEDRWRADRIISLEERRA